MFLLEKLLKKNGITYLYLMESVYDPATGKSKPRIISSFGNRDTFIREHPEKYAELKKLYGSSKEKYKAEKERTIHSFFASMGDSSSRDSLLNNFGCLIPQNYAPLTLRQFWVNELQMTKFFDYLKYYEKLEWQWNVSDIALYFTVLKIMSPGSYLHDLEISPGFLGDPLSESTKDDVCQILQFLGNFKDRIMRHVNDRIDHQESRKKALLLCVPTHRSMAAEQPAAPVVLVTDELGIPMDFQIFPGSLPDADTLVKSLRAFMEKHKIHEAFVSADGALNRSSSLKALHEAALGFTADVPMLTLPREIREKKLDLRDFAPIRDDSGRDTTLLYRVIPCPRELTAPWKHDQDGKDQSPHADCCLMLTFSESRKARDLAALEEDLGKDHQAATHMEDADVTAETRIQSPAALNEDLIRQKKQCAGYACILFQNPGGSDIELTPSYVSTMHHRLIQTGDCLRMLTNDLDLLPPGASYPKCAAGDILLSVLALITVRIIQHQFAREELQVTVPEIRKALKEFILMALFKDEHHCVYLKCAETLERNSDRAGGEDMQISIGDRMFAMLVGQSMPSVSTIEQLREVFKVKGLERSELQLAKMKAGNPVPAS